jgi:hypothetical protein
MIGICIPSARLACNLCMAMLKLTHCTLAIELLRFRNEWRNSSLRQ